MDFMPSQVSCCGWRFYPRACAPWHRNSSDDAWPWRGDAAHNFFVSSKETWLDINIIVTSWETWHKIAPRQIAELGGYNTELLASDWESGKERLQPWHLSWRFPANRDRTWVCIIPMKKELYTVQVHPHEHLTLPVDKSMNRSRVFHVSSALVGSKVVQSAVVEL